MNAIWEVILWITFKSPCIRENDPGDSLWSGMIHRGILWRILLFQSRITCRFIKKSR